LQNAAKNRSVVQRIPIKFAKNTLFTGTVILTAEYQNNSVIKQGLGYIKGAYYNLN
jgi:hypothetical protein